MADRDRPSEPFQRALLDALEEELDEREAVRRWREAFDEDDVGRLVAALRSLHDTPLDRRSSRVGVHARRVADRVDQRTAPTVPAEVDATRTFDSSDADDAPLFDGRYRVLRTLGRGGFGVVLLVVDTLDPSDELALKAILPERASAPGFDKRFRHEIRLLRKLVHPGIPAIFNDGRTSEGEFYYTMELVPGRTLRDAWLSEPEVEARALARRTLQILDVLEHCHAKGVVHRDLKPENVMLVGEGEDERVRVLDFGIAKVVEEAGGLAPAKSLETIGAIGTPHYMSPEQVRGAPVDGRTDLYALGVMLYERLAGRAPFRGDTPMAIATERLSTKAPPLRETGTSRSLERVVGRLLERDPERRASAADLRAVLEPLAGSAAPVERRHWGPRVAVAAALVLVAAGVVSQWPDAADGAPETDPTSSDAPEPERAPEPSAVPKVAGALDVQRARPGGTATVTGRIEAAGGWRVSLGATSFAVDESGAFEATIDVPAGREDGVWELVLAAEREGAERVELARVPVTVDGTPPEGSVRRGEQEWSFGALDGRAEGAVAWIAGEELRLELVVLEPARVVGGAHPGARVDPGTPLAVVMELPSEGLHALEIVLVDDAGNRRTVRFGAVRDEALPIVELASHSIDVALDARSVRVAGRVRDVAPASLAIDGTPARPIRLDEDEQGATFAHDVPLATLDGFDAPGARARLVLVARDRAGNEGTGVVDLRRAELPPAIDEALLRVAYAGGSDQELLVASDGSAKLEARGVEALRVVVRGERIARVRSDGAESKVEGGSASVALRVPARGESLRIELVPIDARGSEGTPWSATIERARALVPAGYEAIGDETDPATGWSQAIRLRDLDLELVLVRPDDAQAPALVAPFYVGAREVTRAQWSAAGLELAQASAATDEHLPVTDFEVDRVGEFLARAGGGLRLPSANEWCAALGAARAYPWGEEWGDGPCNVRADGASALAPAGEHEGDVSWCGARDLVGNAMELCVEDGAKRLIGAAFTTVAPVDAEKLRESKGIGFSSGGRKDLGFRVARDAAP